MAFERAGFCVVRGPDILWGGDVRRFNPPAGRFDGIIGGPPCQPFSLLRHLLKAQGRDVKGVNLIPEFERCVASAQPKWFLMENVRTAPDPSIIGYSVQRFDVTDADVGGDTRRKRRFWFGSLSAKHLVIKTRSRSNLFPLERAVTRNARIPDERHHERKAGRGGILPGDGRYMRISDVCELQGLPRTYFDGSPFKAESIRMMLGNGVPISIGSAVACAIAATEADGYLNLEE